MKLQHRFFSATRILLLPPSKTIKWRFHSAGLLLLAVLTGPAHAIPITYDFIGSAYTPVPQGVLNGVTQTSLSVTVDELTPDFSGSATIVSYLFQDGLTTVDESNTDYSISNRDVRTGANGELLNLNFLIKYTGARNELGAGDVETMSLVWGSSGRHSYFSRYCTLSVIHPTTGALRFCGGTSTASANDNNLIAFTDPILTSSNQVPEPPLYALLSIGLVSVAVTRRRRKSKLAYLPRTVSPANTA